uniref:Mitochondrial transcription rescue factor 1 C-terminal domain-containing protein n=1 Tax=Cercocebus atys TaxID=9531 RepID=A0A2K5MSC8_CERAT
MEFHSQTVISAMAMTSVKLHAGTLSSHKPCTSWNQYLYFSSTKLHAPNYKTLFHNIFSLRLPGLLMSLEYIFPISIRLKSNISSKKSTKKSLQKIEDEEDSDAESDQNEMSEQEEEFEDDLETVVRSFQDDAVLKTSQDIGRNKVEDAFCKGELRLNGEKIWKKSRMVKVGDTLDLLIGENKEAGTETKTESEKYAVVLQRWKNLKMPKKRMSK